MFILINHFDQTDHQTGQFDQFNVIKVQNFIKNKSTSRQIQETCELFKLFLTDEFLALLVQS